MTIHLFSSMSRGPVRRRPGRLALPLLALLAVAPALAAQDDAGSYGYLRVVDGPAELFQAGSDARTDAEINQPVLAGDRLWVPDGSRAEVVLADGNLLRIDGGSEIVLQRLAGSPDADDRQTVLELRAGNVQLVVFENALGDELPRVDTPNATFYVQRPGVFRLTSDQGVWSAFLVREGSAEVLTERGSVVVRADEEALVEGEKFPRAVIQAASGRDALERWAVRLDEEAERYASQGELGDLAYQGSSLGRYGTWHSIGHRRVWRPHVDAGWRPYWHGRWAYTPAGLSWVSYEPWGWVPYHYGSWDYLAGWGWVWEPGWVWAPSWVYWYWGPRYVSWCPVGYYTRYYGYPGYHYGVYGWAGGHYGGWDHWSFVDHDDLGRRDQHAYSRKGYDLKNQLRNLERGIITTDTKGVTPKNWKNPGSVLQVLQQRGGKAGQLPDVTPFVAREPKLPAGVLRSVQAERPEKLAGTPLNPETLGRVGKLRGQGNDTSWAIPRGDGGKRPTVQIGGPSGSGRGGSGQGVVRGGANAGDDWREHGPAADPGSGRGSGKTWDRPAEGGTTGDRGGSGPRIRQPEERGGKSGEGARPEPKVRESESGDSGSGRPEKREVVRPEPRQRESGDSGSSSGSSSGSGGSDSGSSSGSSRGNDSGSQPKTFDRPAPEPPREGPRVRQSEPPQARSSKAWQRPEAYRPSESRASDRPVVRSRPAPEYRPSRPAPEYRPSRPAPEVRSRPSPEYRPSRPAPEVRSRPAPEYRPSRPAPEVRSRPAPEYRPSRPAPQVRPAPQPSSPKSAPAVRDRGSRGGDSGGHQGGSGGHKGNSGGQSSGRSHGRVRPPQS